MDTLQTYIASDGTPLHYRLWRCGHARSRALVLLHGMASNLTRWSEFTEHTRLKQTWDIVRPDLRGHGESFTRGPIGMDQWCEDLLGILDTAGYDQAVFTGHSLGAHVALEFAARHPKRVAGLVLIDPAFRSAFRGRLRLALLLRPLLWLTIRGIRTLNALGLRRRHMRQRDLQRLDEQTRAELLDTGDPAAFVRRYSSVSADLRYFPSAHLAQEVYELLRPVPVLDAIAAPVLLLLSSGLTYTDPERTRLALAALEQVDTVVVDAFHWPLTERPVEVRQAIERWCGRFDDDPPDAGR